MNKLQSIESSTGISPVEFEVFRDAVVWNALSKNTRRAYKHAYNQLLDWLNGCQLSDALLTVYITELDKRGRCWHGMVWLPIPLNRMTFEKNVTF